jgi:hypothetical protein
LQRIINDAINYFYQYDPNFDFDNRHVESDTNYRTRHNKHKIKKYYEQPELEEEKHINDSFKSNDAVLEPFFDSIGRAKRHSDNRNKHPRKRMCSDYNLTKCINSMIAPGKMMPRPKYTLKEVCDNNNFDLSYHDFEDNKVLLGNGAFGEVYLVC